MFKKRIKAISFDLDGTLIQLTSPHVIIKNFLNAHGLQKSTKEVFEALNSITSCMDMLKRLDAKSYYINLNKMILEALGVKEKIHELAVSMYEKWFDYANAELYSDVEEVLARLSRIGIIMGVISDNLSNEVQKVLEKEGVIGYFSVIVTPDISGSFKPDKRIYEEFERRIGVYRSDILHVGDDLKRDYLGALNAGFNAVLLDRSKRSFVGVNKIHTLYELIELVEVANL